MIHQEIRLLKDENQKQNIEIAFLKEKMIQQEQQYQPNRRVKRPIRLIPSDARHDKDLTKHHNNFYGPPTNCFDLARIGFTLNGYYVVNAEEGSTTDNKTNPEVIYCAFKQQYAVQATNPYDKLVEKRVGLVFSFEAAEKFEKILDNISNKNVFQAIKNRPLNDEGYKLSSMNGILTFDSAPLNVDPLYFNPFTGIFRAPKSGFYKFTFQVEMILRKSSENDQADIYFTIYKNGNHIDNFAFGAYNGVRSEKQFALMQEGIFELSKSDKIYLKSEFDYNSRLLESIELIRCYFSGSHL